MNDSSPTGMTPRRKRPNLQAWCPWRAIVHLTHLGCLTLATCGSIHPLLTYPWQQLSGPHHTLAFNTPQSLSISQIESQNSSWPLFPFHGPENKLFYYFQLRLGESSPLCGNDVFAGDGTDWAIEQMIGCVQQHPLLLLTFQYQVPTPPQQIYAIGKYPQSQATYPAVVTVAGRYYGILDHQRQHWPVVAEILHGRLWLEHPMPLPNIAQIPMCFSVTLGDYRPLDATGTTRTPKLDLPERLLQGCTNHP